MTTAFALLDNDVVLTEAPPLPYAGTFRGLDNVVGAIGSVASFLDIAKVKVERIVADGDTAVAFIEIPISAPTDPDSAYVQAAECWRVKDGKIVEIRPYYWNPAALL